MRKALRFAGRVTVDTLILDLYHQAEKNILRRLRRRWIVKTR